MRVDNLDFIEAVEKLAGEVGLAVPQATPQERAFLDRQGELSVAATLRPMARTADGRATLVEVKAVDGAYPLYGAAATDPPAPSSSGRDFRNACRRVSARPASMHRGCR